MDLLTIVFGLVVLLCFILLRHLTKNRGVLEQLGIPVDSPFLLFGSPPYMMHKTNLHEYYTEKHKTLGKTYGRYDGVVPVISTIDPEILKSVLVKNFDSFTDILSTEVVEDKHKTLDLSGGDTWRVLRKNLSPTFTSGKLKGMMEPIQGVADDMVTFVDKKVKDGNGTVEMKEVFQGLAINTIATCAFGININAFNNPDDDLIKYGKEIFSGFQANNMLENVMFQIFTYFPGIERIIPFIPEGYTKVFDIAKSIVSSRKENDIHRSDFLARLMDLQNQIKKSINAEDLNILNDDIIMAQSVIFFIAGYETTSNTLTTTSYNLAMNPEIQDRLYEEITEALETNGGKLDSDTISDMPYLDAVINEDLRHLGPITVHLRTCTKDCEIAPGIVIKKGWRVDMPIYASHHNPDFFPEPHKFKPERFLKENASELIPYTFRPFGGGPRVCIGQRFSMVEMKTALVKLLSKYRFVATPETKINTRKGDLFLVSFDQMKIKLEER